MLLQPQVPGCVNATANRNLLYVVVSMHVPSAGTLNQIIACYWKIFIQIVYLFSRAIVLYKEHIMQWTTKYLNIRIRQWVTYKIRKKIIASVARYHDTHTKTTFFHDTSQNVIYVLTWHLLISISKKYFAFTPGICFIGFCLQCAWLHLSITFPLFFLFTPSPPHTIKIPERMLSLAPIGESSESEFGRSHNV